MGTPTRSKSKSNPSILLPSFSDQAVQACVQFLNDHRVLVEPACGAGLHALYAASDALPSGNGTLVVQVCGGAGVTLTGIQKWCDRFGVDPADPFGSSVG